MASSSPKIDPAEAASAFLRSQAALAQERIDLQRFNDEIAHLKEAKGQAAVEERIQQEQRKWRDADIALSEKIKEKVRVAFVLCREERLSSSESGFETTFVQEWKIE